MKILIKNGRILNPATQTDEIRDLLIEKGVITKSEKNIPSKNIDEVIDANGYWVVPGLIDVHVHLREPGFEYKETIATGTASAAKGGFTTICPMPNTKPTIDCKELVEFVNTKALTHGIVNVLPIGAMTKGQKGEELSDISQMKAAGICALSEDGRSVLNSSLFKKALVLAKEFNLPILSHCEDDHLAAGGCMNEGDISAKLGLVGIPPEAEEVIIARDIILAEKTGTKLHICHVSTEGGVELIRWAKTKGIQVTAEVAPHHFTLTDEAVLSLDANTKMNPPLRTKRDVEVMKNALQDGTIDMIATDHAPHHVDEKTCGYGVAANGIVGLETAVSLTLTEIVHPGFLTPMGMVEKMSYNPAKMLGIDKGNIDIGKIADITIIDPDKLVTIDANTFVSRSKNTPFDGRKVQGEVQYTIVKGIIKYKA
ncbi:MAG: dihydroorotase [Vallitaleaceae bacterium]|nr:dihydroorotase [Vallitaleaceae bacterium]